MEILELFSWMAHIQYVPEILLGLVAVKAFAGFIVNLTPTPKDDKWLGIAYKYIEVLAGIVTKKAKEPNEK